jgi:hypothetical protein
MLIGAVPLMVWGANTARAAATLRTLAPAAVIVDGDALHEQLKQLGIPPSISRVIVYGASVPVAVPVPVSQANNTIVLAWKHFLDAGDQLRGACDERERAKRSHVRHQSPTTSPTLPRTTTLLQWRS